MDKYHRQYPLFAACGLNCGLCPRYHTAGASRCPGCGGEGFSVKHPPCGALSCCLRHGLAYCYLCAEYPCKKYEGVDASDSFITHQNQLTDMAKAKNIGLDAYLAEQDEKVGILRALLEHYNDGRQKTFFCLAINLLEPPDIREVMRQIAAESKPDDSIKEKSALAVRLFSAMAEQHGLALKLRKKQRS